MMIKKDWVGRQTVMHVHKLFLCEEQQILLKLFRESC